MSNNALVRVKDLVKYYGEVKALDGVSFEVYSGEIYGLLGPNGAGKTTTLKIIAGMLKPTQGHVEVMGISPIHNPTEVKRIIGYVPEEISLYESLSIIEFFEFIASVRKLSPSVWTYVSTLMRSFDILGYSRTPIGALSYGTKQKVAIIAALMHKPKILILDEPLRGLDAKSAKILKELMNLHIQSGGAIILSTHIMDLAEHLCTRVGIIHKGKIIAEGSISDLKRLADAPQGTLEEIFLELIREREEVAHIIEAIKRELSV
ncbi:MAG: ABC transporter ATP-binding protein [Candidatus Korarchaeota archaeon]|nr:ABC transporter ATP-binding protein [Thermoproteota archaeon]